MDDLTVRPATRDDLPAVARLAALLVRLHHAFDPQRFLCMEPLEPGYARFLGGELADDDAVVLVAVLAREGREQIVGYAYGRLEPRDWNELLDACGKIHDVFVDEPARGHGAATALVEAIVARLEAKGAPRVVLLSATPNVAAQRLFARLGFRSTMVEMTRETKG
ncbi:MAG: GNAT family N-acetyltransferase [Byssovorax sp.]